jgi:hypothetical protein
MINRKATTSRFTDLIINGGKQWEQCWQKNTYEINAHCFVSILRIGKIIHTHIYIYIYIFTSQSVTILSCSKDKLQFEGKALFSSSAYLKTTFLYYSNLKWISTYWSSVLVLTVGWHVAQVLEIIHGTKPQNLTKVNFHVYTVSNLQLQL